MQVRLLETAPHWLEGNPDAARREALGIVIDLGAQAAAQIIRQRLRMLGARSIPAGPHAATRRRPFGLTRRASTKSSP